MAAAKKIGTHTDLEWCVLVITLGNGCSRCGRTDMRLEKDHIVPVYQGGCDCIGNIQPVCAYCNCSKGPETTDWRGRARADWAATYDRKMCAVYGA